MKKFVSLSNIDANGLEVGSVEAEAVETDSLDANAGKEETLKADSVKADSQASAPSEIPDLEPIWDRVFSYIPLYD